MQMSNEIQMLDSIGVVQQLDEPGRPSASLAHLLDRLTAFERDVVKHDQVEERCCPEWWQYCGSGAEKAGKRLLAEHNQLHARLADIVRKARKTVEVEGPDSHCVYSGHCRKGGLTLSVAPSGDSTGRC